MIRTYPMQEKVSRQEREGLGVSTRELSRVLGLQKLPEVLACVWAEALGQFQSSGLHSLRAFSASSFTKKVPRIFL